MNEQAGLRIGFDFDGVFTDFAALKVEAAHELYAVDVPTSDFKRELVVGAGLLSAAQYSGLQEAVYFETEWCMRMKPLPDALGTFGQLAKDGHEMRVVTSRNEAGVQLAKLWLQRMNIAVDVVGTNRASKRDATAGFDVFIDDDLEKLLEAPHVPNRYLMDHPYNAEDALPESITRVGGWREFYHLVGEITLSS